jgi:adenylate cyclase class 2
MVTPQEIEIKFLVADPKALEQQLTQLGFRCITSPTREVNTLYDLPGRKLRSKGELLRLRRYGDDWRLTHKARAKVSKYKSRTELETGVSNGSQMDLILRALGYQPVFTYEKLRSEWSDGRGHVVLDHTPIGDIAEIEGKARWIDQTARGLRIAPSDYVTKSYAELFFDWKRKYKRKAMNMTFREIGGRAKPGKGASGPNTRTRKRSTSVRSRKSSAEAEAGSGV